MKSLITGGAGFIGSHLAEALLEKGHEVICFDNMSTGKPKNIEHLKDNSNFSFVEGDANTDQLDAVFKNHKFDWVFHYAAVVGVKRTLENPMLVLKDIEGIKNILKLSKEGNVKKVMFASSSEVYGHPVEVPEREDGVINASLPYAAVKLIGEKFMESYYQEYGLKTCSLRLFNVYGPRQIDTDYGFVVGIFIKQALANQQPTVFGDGTQTRDFVYVKDNVNTTIEAAKSDKTNGEVINLGNGNETSVLELAKNVIEVSGKKLEPKFMESRDDEIKRRSPDVTKMKQLIDYETQYSLEAGLKKTMEWYENEG